MRRGLILVEGQTEERFVKDTVAPAFYQLNFGLVPAILVTKKVKDGPNFKGGILHYSQFKNDINRLLHGSGGAIVTMMLDYYKLPGDFPGMNSRPPGTAERRASHVEQAILKDLGSPLNFLPFLALHEFEAWLFSCPDTLPTVLTERSKQRAFAAICNSYETPEEINEGSTTAPSKRILTLFPRYQKTLHGPTAANRIGLDRIRAACPHFNSWFGQLEVLATNPDAGSHSVIQEP